MLRHYCAQPQRGVIGKTRYVSGIEVAVELQTRDVSTGYVQPRTNR